KTSVTNLPDGKRNVTFTFTPKDKYGNNLGPGRADILIVSGASGTGTNGHVTDNGDGTYIVAGTWDPSTGNAPGIIINQPGKNPVVISDQTVSPQTDKWKFWFWIVLILFLLLLLYLL